MKDANDNCTNDLFKTSGNITEHIGNITEQQLTASNKLGDTPNTPDTTNTPDMASSAMLVTMGVSVWEGKRTDKAASIDVTNTNHAKRGSAKVIKSLLADCPELEEIKKLRGKVRNHIHYALTMPWSDSGLRLLTTKAYFEYHQQMTNAQAQFNQLVHNFLQAYDYKVAEAQVSLGTLFNATEYPSREDIRGKFALSFNYIPLPSAGDFRVDIGNDQKDALREDYDKFYSDQFKAAMSTVWQRLQVPLANMSKRLGMETEFVSTTDDNGITTIKEKRPVMHASLVDNVLDMVDLLDMANVTNDPDMNAVHMRLSLALRGVTSTQLKNDDRLRKDTKKAADDVLAKIAALPSLM